MSQTRTFAIVCAVVITIVGVLATNALFRFTTTNQATILGAYSNNNLNVDKSDTDIDGGAGPANCREIPINIYVGWPFTAAERYVDCDGEDELTTIYPLGIGVNSMGAVAFGFMSYVIINLRKKA
ncbi:MAG: hypothetical protein QG649_789 [Patescibacteria group bacterium]|nr:hypothetical protein [Patescibacteria group bacterium]